MKKFLSSSVLISAFLILASLVSCQAAHIISGNPVTKWEYKTIVIENKISGNESPLTGPGDLTNCVSVLGFSTTPTDTPFSSVPCVSEDGNKDTLALLNRLGQDGWELVATVNYPMSANNIIGLLFKRPIP
jgi:hypothetical protein